MWTVKVHIFSFNRTIFSIAFICVLFVEILFCFLLILIINNQVPSPPMLFAAVTDVAKWHNYCRKNCVYNLSFIHSNEKKILPSIHFRMCQFIAEYKLTHTHSHTFTLNIQIHTHTHTLTRTPICSKQCNDKSQYIK